MGTALIAALASAGLNLLAEAIQKKGKEVVERKLGIKIPDDPSELTPDRLEELHRIEIEREVDLIELIQTGLDSISAYKSIEVADRMDARRHEVEIAVSEAPLFLKYVKPMLALLTTLVCAGLLFALLFVDVPPNKKELLMFALGSVFSSWGMVMAYYFGTSESSDYKNRVFEMLLRASKTDREGMRR